MAESLTHHGRVGLVDLRTARFLATLAARNGPDADALAFFPNGRMLATGGTNGTVTIWDVRRRSVVQTLPTRGRVWWVAVSPDGKLLASQTKARGSSSSLSTVEDLTSRSMRPARGAKRQGRFGFQAQTAGRSQRWLLRAELCRGGLGRAHGNEAVQPACRRPRHVHLSPSRPTAVCSRSARRTGTWCCRTPTPARGSGRRSRSRRERLIPSRSHPMAACSRPAPPTNCDLGAPRSQAPGRFSIEPGSIAVGAVRRRWSC